MFEIVLMLIGYWFILSAVAALIFIVMMRPPSPEERARKEKEDLEETLNRLTGKKDK
jgi:hypothetical protein